MHCILCFKDSWLGGLNSYKRRMIAALTAFCMLTVPMAGTAPDTVQTITAHATEKSGKCGENLTWTIDTNDHTLTISGTGAMYDYSTENKAPFGSSIYLGWVDSIIIQSGVTSIGNCAFYMCEHIKSVTVPDTVTSIGDSAFRQCRSMTTVNIPNNVTSIEPNTFSSCESLTSVKIPNKVTSIGEFAFYSCEALTSVAIPDGVTSIEQFTFSHCKSLTSVSLPGSLTSIGWYSFSDCTNLRSLKLPATLAVLEGSAFEDCSSLTSVSIPASVRRIDRLAFGNCTSLTAITVSAKNEKYTALDGVLFTKDKQDLVCYPPAKEGTYTIPDNVTNIGDYAFKRCAGLSAVTIPDSVEEIGSSAFYGCTSLTDVVIPRSVKWIESEAFYLCGTLKSVTILNPWCHIESKENTFINSPIGFTGYFYGFEGSSIKNYAKEFGLRYLVIIDPSQRSLGDVNGDSYVNAEDAALVLQYAAALGVGETPEMLVDENARAEKAAKYFAETNADGAINAKDANTILRYSAAVGTGVEINIWDL